MRFLPRRLYSRIVLLVSLVITGTVVGYGWVISSREAALLGSTLRAEAATTAEYLALTSARPLVVGDYAALEEFSVWITRLPRIVRTEFHDPSGAGLVGASSEPGSTSSRVLDRIPPRMPPTERFGMAEAETGQQITLWRPVRAGGLLGWIRITYDLGEIDRTVAGIWRQSIVLGFWCVLGSSAVFLVLLRPPMVAIRRISAFARDLNTAKGAQVEVRHRSTEVDQLVASLNAASRELLSTEQELRAERERLEVTLRSIGEAVIVADNTGAVTLMNGVAERLTGWTMGEALGQPAATICRLMRDAQEAPPDANPFTVVLEKGAPVTLPEPATLVSRDGSVRNIAASSAPIRDQAGRALGVVTVMRDVSERVRLEEQLRQSQKMEAVGQLAGGIAHDFNNILTAIMGYANLLQLEMAPDDELLSSVDQILTAAERAANLTKGLLTFSRKQVVNLRPVDLNDIVLGMVNILRRLICEDIELTVRVAPQRLSVIADQGQIEQVLMNLVMNSRDAMPHGGTLTISTGERAGEGDVRWAVVTVADTGVGMNRTDRDKIFTPFFTTKEVGKGTGLGLAIVYGIVTQHQGRIEIESEPGAGATFRVLLPRVQTPGGSAPAEKPPAPRGGTETILLVEDDPAVREVTRILLEGAGYAVVTAADGDEGLACVVADPGRFDLLLSDVVMPRMNGRQLLTAIRELTRRMKVLFISGYPAEISTAKGLLDPGTPFLQKPLRQDILLRRIREILDT